MSLTKNQEQLLRLLRRTAPEMGTEGRALTQLIGELSACKFLGLTWKPTDGFDARDCKGKRVQVKTRKSWSTAEVNRSGRIGRFGKKGRYAFDHGVYVELGELFEAVQIRRLSKRTIKLLESGKTEERGVHVSEVIRHGRLLYPEAP